MHQQHGARDPASIQVESLSTSATQAGSNLETGKPGPSRHTPQQMPWIESQRTLQILTGFSRAETYAKPPTDHQDTRVGFSLIEKVLKAESA